MASTLKFTRAPTVAVGDPITSTQWEKLAAAFNDRIRSGIGDATWRIWFLFLAMFRQVRNPNIDTGLPAASAFAPQREFFDVYQTVNADEVEWPMTGPGDPEGANLANPIMTFVFGSAASGLDSEADRFSHPDGGQLWPGGEPASNYEAWFWGKRQRGAVDPATGGMSSPALDIGVAHYRIAQSDRSPYGRAYGGYMPLPEEVVCADPNPDDDIPPPVGYKYRFTKLSDSASGTLVDGRTYHVISGTATYDGVSYPAGFDILAAGGVSTFTGTAVLRESVVYPGSCQPTPDEPYAEHVAYVAYWPWAYYVFTNGGSVDVYLANEWVDGPYRGRAELRKTDFDMGQMMLNQFAREFRGADGQRSNPTYHLAHAFKFHEFMTRQYRLAPNIGLESGGDVTPYYPEWSGPPVLGSELNHDGGGTAHVFNPSFVFGGAFLSATGLSGTVILEAKNGSEVLGTVVLEPNESGVADALFWPDADHAGISLSWEVKSTAGPAGWIEVEAAELFPYKPQIQDTAFLLRIMSCLPTTPDGAGNRETEADTYWDDYDRWGIAMNRAGQIVLPDRLAAVNANAVFDSLRRMSKWVRSPNRRELKAYAVEGGKSVLWFARHAYGLSTSDTWEGIAPQAERMVSGDLEEGREYVVREGIVTYQGAEYSAGESFTAVADSTFAGSGKLYQKDGILHTALKAGETNEWMLGVYLGHYNNSESSIWKPEAYSDWVPPINRCHFFSPEIANNPSTLWHVAFGQRVATRGNVLAESPSGYNYADLEFSYGGSQNVNHDAAGYFSDENRSNFYKSCRVYEPDAEVESVEDEVQDGGEVWVKVTLKGRLHHHEDAPDEISRDVGAWNVDQLRAEAAERRTWENGIREYLVLQAHGLNCVKEGFGNAGLLSSIYVSPGGTSSTETDIPWGACWPQFVLTKLVPVPYLDDNDSQQGHDTKLTHDVMFQAAVYLRAMCEGYVDGVTSAEVACQLRTTSVYDFTWQSLMLQANGNRWLSPFVASDRDDNPQGFSALPNTYARAEVFNDVSRALNMLTTVRVMLPAKLECSVSTGIAARAVTVYNADDSEAECFGPTSVITCWLEDTPDVPDVSFDFPSWDTCIDATVVHSAQLTGECVAPDHEFRSFRQGVQWRWNVQDPEAVNALPESWRDLVWESPMVLAEVHYQIDTYGRALTNAGFLAEDCNGTKWINSAGVYYYFPNENYRNDIECALMSSPMLPPECPQSAFARAYTPSGAECVVAPESRMEVTVINATTPMVRIPLKD